MMIRAVSLAPPAGDQVFRHVSLQEGTAVFQGAAGPGPQDIREKRRLGPEAVDPCSVLSAGWTKVPQVLSLRGVLKQKTEKVRAK